MPSTPLGLPYPSASSAPTVQADLQTLATTLNARVIYPCTVATRPTLTGTDEGVIIFQTDNNLYAEWDGAAWRAIFVYSCTVATRPATGLISGQIIYQTDTLSYLYWNGTSWDDLGAGGFTPSFLLMGA